MNSNLRLSDIVSLGAAATILLVGLDPFAQQLVSYPLRTTSISADDVFVLRVTRFTEPAGDFGALLEPSSIPQLIQRLDDIFQQAVYNGLWNGPPQWNVSCPNGNCTFPPITSLSWCSQCVDASNEVAMAGDGMNIDFGYDPPNITLNPDGSKGFNWAYAHYGLTINTGQFELDVTLNSSNAAEYETPAPYSSTWSQVSLQVSLYVPTSHIWDIYPGWAMYRWDPGTVSGRFGNIGRPAVSLGHVELGYDRYVPFRNLTVRRGSVCALNPCLREYAISVEAGRVSTTVLSTDYGVIAQYIPGVNSSSPFAPAPSCWVGNYTNITFTDNATICDLGGTSWPACDVDTTYMICDVDAMRQAQIVTDALVGNQSAASLLQGPASAFVSMSKTDHPISAQRITRNTLNGTNITQLSYIEPWSWQNYPTEQYSSSAYRHALVSGSLENTLDNIAAALTVALQRAGGSRVHGQTSVTGAYIHVHWFWIIYPVVILLLGLVFVAWTIIGSGGGNREVSGASLWKSSSLALLYHGLVDVSHETRLAAGNVVAMETLARQMQVQFDGMVLEHAPSP